MPILIEIADDLALSNGHERLRRAAEQVLNEAGIESGEISIAVVNDQQMHALNREYLNHDYPTDVLSFVLEQDPEKKSLDGEIVVSADYASREAIRYGWNSEDELLLYVIHGSLHLAGHDDQTPEAKAIMREAETRHLQAFGLIPRYSDQAD